MAEKKLGLFAVTSLTLVALIGTGMFFGPALSAQFGGAAAILVWIILGLQTVYVGTIFAELASLFPKAGGIYEFAKQAYGRFPSFLIGWVMWLVATINTSILIVGALLYAFPLLPTTQQLLVAMLLLVVLHFIAYRGLGASAILLDFFAAALIVFVLLTIIGGVPHMSATNYTPFFTQPLPMLAVALFFILETFFGWEAASFLAEETKNPRKTIPKAIIISCGIAAILGMLLATIMFGVIPAGQLADSTTPLVDVFAIIFGDAGQFILRIGVFLALIGSAAGNIIAGPRLLLAMARDKLFIEQLSDVSPKTNTPGKAILFQAIVSAIVLYVALGQYTLLLSIMVPLALVMYVPTLLALPVLRFKVKTPRLFKAPFGYIGPIIASGVFVAALVGWLYMDPAAASILKFIGSLVLFGFPIYLLLSIYYNPGTQLFFADMLAYPALALESLTFPKKIRHKILSLFKDLEGKTLLEIGAGVGSLTMHLAEAVTPQGTVYAVDAGKNNIDVLLKRVEKRNHKHVHPIHDEFTTSRLHPDIDHVDAVFSTGMLGFLQNKNKVLKEIGSVMPEHAPIVFMEWVDYFGILPNPKWLNDLDAIKQEFQDAGFAVRIDKVKGLFWNYLLVSGVKSRERIAYI